MDSVEEKMDLFPVLAARSKDLIYSGIPITESSRLEACCNNVQLNCASSLLVKWVLGIIQSNHQTYASKCFQALPTSSSLDNTIPDDIPIHAIDLLAS